jgi:hypothetical protein
MLSPAAAQTKKCDSQAINCASPTKPNKIINHASLTMHFLCRHRSSFNKNMQKPKRQLQKGNSNKKPFKPIKTSPLSPPPKHEQEPAKAQKGTPTENFHQTAAEARRETNHLTARAQQNVTFPLPPRERKHAKTKQKAAQAQRLTKTLTTRIQHHAFPATENKKCATPTGNSQKPNSNKKLRQHDGEQNNQPHELRKALSLTPLNKQKLRKPNRGPQKYNSQKQLDAKQKTSRASPTTFSRSRSAAWG